MSPRPSLTAKNLALAGLVGAMLTVTAACGSSSPSTKPSSSTSPSTVVTGPSAADKQLLDAAHAAYKAAANALDGKPFALMIKAAQAGDRIRATTEARTARTNLYNFDAAIRAITLPASAQAAMNAVLEANRTEIANLDRFASVTSADLSAAWARLQLDDFIGLRASDQFYTALGRPWPAVVLTDDDYNVAFATWIHWQNSTAPKWRAAVAAGNLDQARTITAQQRAATIAFSKAINALNIPDANKAAAVTLRAALAGYVTALNNEYAMTSTTEMAGSKVTENAVGTVSRAGNSLQTQLDSAAKAAIDATKAAATTTS